MGDDVPALPQLLQLTLQLRKALRQVRTQNVAEFVQRSNVARHILVLFSDQFYKFTTVNIGIAPVINIPKDVQRYADITQAISVRSDGARILNKLLELVLKKLRAAGLVARIVVYDDP